MSSGVFTVERHERRKWTCLNCRSLIHALVAACGIGRENSTNGLLAQMCVPLARCADQLRCPAKEVFFGRDRLDLPPSPPAQWVDAGVAPLQPSNARIGQIQNRKRPDHHSPGNESHLKAADPGLDQAF